MSAGDWKARGWALDASLNERYRWSHTRSSESSWSASTGLAM
jgi:hypothetical protein